MKDVVLAVMGFSVAACCLSGAVFIVSYTIRDTIGLWRSKK